MADYGHAETDKRLARLESKIDYEYGSAITHVRKKLNAYFKQFDAECKAKKALVQKGLLSQSDFNRWKLNKMLTGDRWDDLLDVLSTDHANRFRISRKLIGEHMKDIYALNHNYGAYEIENGAGMNLSFTLYDHATVERLLKDNPDILPQPGKKTLQDIAAGKAKKWSKRELQSIATQAILSGDSIPEIANTIAKKFGVAEKYQAIRAARTMTTTAENAGRMDSYRRAEELGIKMKKTWLATLDKRTRHEHRQLDGMMQEVDKPFKVDGDEIMYPGDLSAPGYLVYNCRCTLIAAVEGTSLGGGIQGLERHSRLGAMSYEEWKNKKQNIVSYVIQGKDISLTWQRRPDKFDFEIEDVINAQGFDGVPRILSAEEFDEAVKQSNFIAQRTYSAPNQETLDAYREQLYNGKWYVDCSTGGAQYGQGMYCAADYTGTLSDGIKNEMEHYRDLSESRYGDAQREYAEKVYQEEIDKVNFPLDDKYKNAFTDEMGITDMWTRGSEERKFIKDWISKNPAEANRLKEAYEKAQEIGAKKGMEIESLTREQFKEKYPNIGARSYTETITLAPDAKIVTWSELNDIRKGTLSIEYRNEVLEKELKRRGLAGDELTFARYNAGLGVSWNEVDAAARRLGAEKRNAVMEQLEDAGKATQKLFDEEQTRRRELAHMYQEKYHDIGSLAAALGYDAINAENHGQSGSYTVILNRTKVIFRRP